MLKVLLWASGGTGFTFLLTALGAATVFLFRKTMADGMAKAFFGFAAGVMIAASVWSMLIPAIEDAEAMGMTGWIPASVGFLAGVGLMIGLDWLVRRVKGRGKDRTTMLFLAVTFHNIPEGMAVGLAFALAAGREEGSLLLASAAALALGIGIQNFPEGAALALPLWKGGRTPLKAFAMGTLSGAVEPLFGILAALLAGSVTVLMPWLLAFAAGAMMYVVVEEIIPEAASRTGTLGAITGFVVMMILDVALG